MASRCSCASAPRASMTAGVFMPGRYYDDRRNVKAFGRDKVALVPASCERSETEPRGETVSTRRTEIGIVCARLQRSVEHHLVVLRAGEVLRPGFQRPLVV